MICQHQSDQTAMDKLPSPSEYGIDIESLEPNEWFKFNLSLNRIILNRWYELMVKEMDDAIADIESVELNETNVLDRAAKIAKWNRLREWTLRLNKIFDQRYGSEIDKLRLIGEFFQIESFTNLQGNDVPKRLDWYKRRLAKDFERRIYQKVDANSVKSPIEQIFLMEWEYLNVDTRLGVTLTPQHKVVLDGTEYRVDFVVTKLGHQLNLAIELDGHEFHERTKEQAAKDRARERTLTRANFTVVRFTGSEIVKNPRRCVEEVVTLIETRIRSL